MKESAASEKKAESSSAMKRKEAASFSRDGRGAADQPLMSIVQRCRDCSPSVQSLAGGMMQTPVAQRRAAAMSLQRARGNSFLQRMAVQAKLVVGPADDKYEREADRMARQVVDTISSPDQNTIQKQDFEEELRRKVDWLAPVDVGPDLESAIQRARSGGQPLSDGVRQPMERAFGADFGGVRVHADGQADSLSRSLQARAFTTGQEIFLRRGEYQPGSSAGQRLLAHELTHVVQQNGGMVRNDTIQREFIGEIKDKNINHIIPELLNSYGIVANYAQIRALQKSDKTYQSVAEIARALQPNLAVLAEAVPTPPAEPVAKPVARPVASPAPPAEAIPVAEPVAKPVARPVASPAPTAKAIPVAEPVAEPSAEAIPGSFTRNPKSAIGFLTRNMLEEILPSYLPDVNQRNVVMDQWQQFVSEEGFSYQTVPQLIERALGKVAADIAIDYVKIQNEIASPAREEARAISTLYRGDTRPHGQIITAKGLHGWGGSMSLVHARLWVENVWNRMNTSDRNAWLQNWKSETSSRVEAMPFLATGWESQKPGAEYRIDVPFQIPNPMVNAQVSFNGNNLENSSIICITGRGEVVFLTGIPVKYITPVVIPKS